MAAFCSCPSTLCTNLQLFTSKLGKGGGCVSRECHSGIANARREAQWGRIGSAASFSRAVACDSLLEASLAQTCQSNHSAGWRPLRVMDVGWDPEGILGDPVIGHISRRSSQKSLAQAEAEREDAERRRRVAREARVVPDTDADLIDYFLQTETQEVKYEVARCRPRLTDGFFAAVRSEIGQLRFAAVQTDVDQERLAQLESMEKALTKEVGEYDSMAREFLTRKDVLQEILLAKDKKACLLGLAAEARLDPPLLALLDHNIASAIAAREAQTAEFMQKLRAGVVKYMTF